MSDSHDDIGDLFDRANEDEIIENPAFQCNLCGFANVRLVEIRGQPAAKCTNCGAGYLNTNHNQTGGEP
jgi:hypothetical protein